MGAACVVFSGEWRGLPVAVKTMVYEATPGEEQQAAAVMETAISASVGHRNVVSCVAPVAACASAAGLRLAML